VKLFIFVVVLALLGWWGYNHGYIKPERLGIGGSASTSSGAQGESLQATLNRGLPRMVTGEISLDRAAANSLAVSFEYRLVDLDEYAVAQRYGSTLPAEMQSQLFRDLCNNRALREQVLAKGRDVLIQVRAQEGRTMFTTQLRAGAC
jgi:hypothetical protein